MNWFPVPQRWTNFNHQVKPSGFEAVSFQRGNEIVISFAGTDPGDLFGDVAADIALALGLGSDQLREAAVYYLEVRAANPEAVITFTGHSLGGGLAALMGVFFDRPAVTFDQAPFAASTAVVDSGEGNLAGVHVALLNHLRGLGYADYHLRPLETYIGLTDRQHWVSGQYVVGEFLTDYPIINWLSGIGNQTPLEHGANNLSGIDLHSQALLAAFVLNDGFRQVTMSLPDLGKLLFDSALYYHDPNDTENPQRNYLENLLRHQVGVNGAIEADKMLSRFTSDLQKLAATDGLSESGTNLTKALIAFAMQAYYDGPKNSEADHKLYEAVEGGVHFDRSDIGATLDDIQGLHPILQAPPRHPVGRRTGRHQPTAI
ncbi:hypothetical protein VX159_05745 [Dechloromonas sp. ZY10]|uniref:lipase family protein n=1 Tax=Dechloromonas aquae TaxID=2664436 RepID=UPI0035293A17